MKKIIRNILAVVMIFSVIIIGKSITVNAAAYNDYPAQTNVSPWKVWSIKFNKDVSLSSAQNNIAVYDSSGNIVSTAISIGNQNNVVLVQPKSSYTLGKQYYMVIKSTLSSLQSSKNLNSDVRMYFTIKNQLDPSDYGPGNSAGIPNVTGLIIVGSDRAYSVSYLLQHADIANDINGNTSKSVYYIPDPTNAYYQSVKNIFGNINTYYNMSSLHNTVPPSLSDTITYTDSIGNTYQYVWNNSIGYYVLTTPGVNVTINSPSTTGSVSITVSSVNAISGAKYYKIDGTNITRTISATDTNAATAVFASMNPYQKIDILSSDQTELGYGYINVSTATTTNITFPITTEQSPHGNTGGNSNNNGSAVLDETGTYTYYLNTGDNNTIYKTDATGEYNQQIGLDKAQYMNEQSGWIYYSNYSDNQKIYRIKTDGSRREKVCDDSAAYLVVSGRWIYYSNHSQQGRLYKIGVSAGASNKDEIQPDPSTYTIDAAGTHGLPIDTIDSSQIVPYDEVAYINVADNWIYYVNNSDDHKIYKIDIDGNFRTKVNDEWSACPQVVDGEIYYCSKTGEIMKIGTDGTNDAVDLGEQADDSNSDRSLSINVCGDWIYYSNKNDNKTLYKVKNDGSGEKYKLTNFPIYYVEAAGDKLYIDSTSNIEYTLPIDTTGGDTPIPVGKTSPDNQIVKVDDLTRVVDYEDVDQPIAWLEDRYLPDKVTAVMNDNKQQELTVSWDTVNKTFKNGIWYYKGTIVGYDKTVNLQLIIPSQMLNGTNDIKVTNNPGSNDVVKISPEAVPVDTTKLKNPNLTELQAKPGDIIRIYGDNSKDYLLGKGTVGSNRIATITGLDLDLHGDDFYITIQRVGKYESDFTKIVQMEPPTILKDTNTADTNNDDVDARDTDNIGLGVDGRDFTMYGWNEAHWSSDLINGTTYDTSKDYNNMYILPTGTSLDMTNAKPISILDANKNSVSNIPLTYAAGGTTQVDPSVKLDSLAKKLTGGYYSIYISRHYNDPNSDTFVTADPNGSRPIVTGDTSVVNSAAELVTSEGIPDQPEITGPGKLNPLSANNIMVTHGDSITLKQPLSTNEQVWFVPSSDTNIIANIRAWRAQDNQTGAANNMNDFYAVISKADNQIIQVKGSSKQNNFSVDSLDPLSGTTKSLIDGKSYYVFVLNDVGASLEATKFITADYTAPKVGLTNKPTTTPHAGASAEYTVTDKGSDTVSITYGDTSPGYGGSPGTVYILSGQISGSMDLGSIKLSAMKTVQVGITGNPMYSSTQFATNYYTIFAVDAAGNISDPVVIYINNPYFNNSGGGKI